MKNLSIVELADITASKSAVPGGGSMAALCGGLSAALVEMVANLTIGNKKYTDAEEKMSEAKNKAEILRHGLLDDIEKDSQAYSEVMKAYKLPKITDEDKKIRSAVIQNGLKNASLIPLEIAEKACRVLELSAVVVEYGNKNAVTDGMVSAMMARTAGLAALLNARINLGFIRDTAFVDEMSRKVQAKEAYCIDMEEKILNSVTL